jgi:hypothetical protein
LSASWRAGRRCVLEWDGTQGVLVDPDESNRYVPCLVSENARL